MLFAWCNIDEALSSSPLDLIGWPTRSLRYQVMTLAKHCCTNLTSIPASISSLPAWHQLIYLVNRKRAPLLMVRPNSERSCLLSSTEQSGLSVFVRQIDHSVSLFARLHRVVRVVYLALRGGHPAQRKIRRPKGNRKWVTRIGHYH